MIVTLFVLGVLLLVAALCAALFLMVDEDDAASVLGFVVLALGAAIAVLNIIQAARSWA